MGWFGKFFGPPDDAIIENGLLGRADVLSVTASGMTVQIMNSLVERKCDFQLRVYLDGRRPYEATCTQRVPEVYLPQLASGHAVVAVRVDPDDPSRVAIDFDTPVPEVTLPPGEGKDGAAWILANGIPADVVLVQTAPMNVKSQAGDAVHALVLTVDKGPESYQVTVGNAVPGGALPLLYPGSRLKARIGEDPTDVVVDWEASAAARK